jgi:2,5-diamino-6-(ribosylamino)-4(3H)-pyrimidinone 5'-phosphate reductase
MMASIDGRIVVSGWPNLGEGRSEYERTATTYDADAWMCGRITMEPFAGAVRDANEVAREAATRSDDDGAARGDFKAPEAHPPYAVAVDPSGRLLWQANDIEGDHVVAVLADRVSDDYLAQLRARGVSYVFAASPEDGVDLATALEKLAATFGIRTLLLEGGGRVNGAMLRDGLIDEVSLLIAPVADGTLAMASLFDVDNEGPGGRPRHHARRLALATVERLADDVLWLRYRVDPD